MPSQKEAVRSMDHLDVTNVEEVMNGDRPEESSSDRPKAQKKEKPKIESVGEPKEEPRNEPEQSRVGTVPTPEKRKPDIAGLPNPLGLELTECGLPADFVFGDLAKHNLTQYVNQHIGTNDLMKIDAITVKERPFYNKYRDMTRGKRHAISRDFAAALRLITNGSPLKPKKQPDIVLKGIQ